MMIAERWEQVERLFSEAVELSAGERGCFLVKECGADTELLEEVESLLRADSKNGEGVLKAIEREAQSLFNLEGVIGSRIGAYRIVSEVGRGGMGTVYLAVRDDDHYQRRVAIKLIRRGMDTEDILDRFRRERQILANLAHPHIATLFDGGTAPDGRPFLVMEYVEGQTLDVYCDDHNLELTGRCRLFLKVCEAVSFAHRNLVVHRDLKPGNILVTAGGTPKLLDFGIARLLTADPAPSRTGLLSRLATPDYASPEEVRGEPIATASDIYSLGTILYELLSGQRAHRFSSYRAPEVERVICEVDPPKPSEVTVRWSKRIRGDLDAIVSKALRKEPAMRYASVEQFAADIECYLNGWSVRARQGNVAYRTAKFLRRNGAAITFGSLFAAVLIGGATLARLQARRATQEAGRAEASQREATREAREAGLQRHEAEAQRRQAELARVAAENQHQIAERRFEQVRQLARRFLIDFHDAIAKLPGSVSARKMVVETGLQYYDTLVSEAGNNRELLEEIARGYDRLGDVQGNPYYANLGDTAGALASYRKALAIREKISDASESFLAERITGNTKIAQLLTISGDVKGADRILIDTLAIGRQQPVGKSYVVRETLARTYAAYGDLKIRTGDFSNAVEPYSKMLDISSSLAGERRNPVSERSGISLSHAKLGDTYTRIGQGRQALEHLQIALGIDEQLAAEDPDSVPRLRKVYIDCSLLGVLFRSIAGQQLTSPAEARTVMEKATEMAGRMAAADPNNATAMMDVFTANSGIGDWLREHHEPETALVHYRKAVEAAEKTFAAGPPTLATYDALVQAHQRLGVGLTQAGQIENALEYFQKADEQLAAAQRISPGLTRLISRRADIASGRADAHKQAGHWPEAIAAYRAAIEAYSDLRSRDSKNAAFLSQMPALFLRLADCYAAEKQWSPAEQALQAGLDCFTEITSFRTLQRDEENARQDGLAKLSAWKGQ
jgi:tetratricopeptide (TPR) repeat protein